MTNLFERPVVPVASPEDAAETYDALRPYLLDAACVPVVVHVIEKAGGAPDKAGVEQREEYAESVFEVFRDHATMDDIEIETEILYGTDVAEAIHDGAEELGASAIIFRSRGGGRWLDLVSGGVRRKLISAQRVPVVVLPDSTS